MTLADQEQDERASTEGKPSQSGGRRHMLVEWVVIVVVALVAALLIKTFAIQAFYIPSQSMEPTLLPGDRVLVNKLAYDFHPVHTGDIVVFRRPPNDTTPGIDDLIKRVIGLPGQTRLRGQLRRVHRREETGPALSPEGVAEPVVGVLHDLDVQFARPLHGAEGFFLRYGGQQEGLLRLPVLGAAPVQLHSREGVRADVAAEPPRFPVAHPQSLGGEETSLKRVSRKADITACAPVSGATVRVESG